MNRLALCTTAALMLAAGPSFGQLDFDAVEFRTTALADHIHMLSGAGGNLVLLVHDNGTLLVDDEFAEMTDKLRAAIAGITDQPLRYVLNTHWHFDHTGGNKMVGEGGAMIVAHENVRERMSSDQVMGLLGMEVPASPEVALPQITFGHRMTLHIGDETVTAHHVAHAHTDGDAFVHFESSNVIHAGDLFWNGSYPFIDTGSGGGIDGMIQGVRRMLALSDDTTRIVPGHGPLGDKKDLADYLKMLETTRERLLALVNEGVAREVVRFKPVMKDYDKTWGQGFMTPERYILIVFDDLARK